MKLTPEIAAALESGSLVARWLIWVQERSGARNTLGLTTAESDLRLPIEGAHRAHIGAGPVLGVPEISHETGTIIQNQRLTLSIIDTKVINLIRNYNVRLMNVELRVAFFDADTDAFIGSVVAFVGTIDGITIKEGKTSSCEVVVSSLNRSGTKTLYLRKSDASQKIPAVVGQPMDNGRKYASVAGTITVAWGQKNESVFRMRRRG